MKVAFGTVLYKKAISYFDEFFQSVINQTNKEFDIVLIIDDLLPEEIAPFIDKNSNEKCNIKTCYSNKKSKPYELRIQLIEYVKENKYDLLIIGDCDDVFSENRIETIVKEFCVAPNVAFFYNQICLFDNSIVLGELPKVTEHIDQIGEKNYLGLSNTALNMRLLDDNIISDLKQGDTLIFDWYLYSVLLIHGLKGIFVEGALSFYRIHGNNLAGITNLSEDNIKKEITIKIEHYKLLSKHSEYHKKLLRQYQDLIIEQKELYKNNNYYWWNLIQLN